MITHSASLDVSRTTLATVTGWVARARRYPGARTYQRAVGPARQSLLVLRWLRDAIAIWRLARDAGVSQATAYRYLHEALDALAQRAPTLAAAIAAAKASGARYLCIDGTLIPTDRVAARKADGRHLYYSGKHKQLGVNIQVIADASGFPLWVSDGSPGSTHDITAARTLVLPHLYPHTALNRPDRIDVLADKGYTGAGAGVRTPHKRSSKISEGADPTGATYSQLITSLRAIAEGANARLSQRWHALRRVTLDPSAAGIIAAAALTLIHLERR